MPPGVKNTVGPRTAAGRLLSSGVVGVLAGALARIGLPDLGSGVHTVLAWDIAGATLLARVWLQILSEDATQTQRHAAAEDPGRHMVWGVVLMASTVSLFAAGFVLRQAHHIAPTDAAIGVLTGLCLGAVVGAWFLTHTYYALRYAHLYYRDDDDDNEDDGGLTFPGAQPPDALDFAYFAFTLGMCFQVSDVCITSREIRRTALGHALLAFLFNTVIVALALNLAFSYLN
jgi:uncharacterized membrane protein